MAIADTHWRHGTDPCLSCRIVGVACLPRIRIDGRSSSCDRNPGVEIRRAGISGPLHIRGATRSLCTAGRTRRHGHRAHRAMGRADPHPCAWLCDQPTIRPMESPWGFGSCRGGEHGRHRVGAGGRCSGGGHHCAHGSVAARAGPRIFGSVLCHAASDRAFSGKTTDTAW